MTLRCARCGSHALEFTVQSYTETHLYEGYRCENCGAEGSYEVDDVTGSSQLSGDIEDDGYY